MNILKISSENAEYQIIESLKTNRTKRSKHKEIFIEGIESIKQAVLANIELTRIITVDMNKVSGWAKQLISNCNSSKIIEMSDLLYKKLCDREEPTEIVVTAKINPITLDKVLFSKKPFVLIFDRPSDHGNFGPEFNDEVQKGRSIGPSTIATKTCIVCLPQLQNTGASLWKVITQKPQKSIYTCPLLNEKKYL